MGNYIEESNTLVSKREAFKYIRENGRSFRDFVKDNGDQDFYRAADVIFWLDM